MSQGTGRGTGRGIKDLEEGRRYFVVMRGRSRKND